MHFVLGSFSNVFLITYNDITISLSTWHGDTDAQVLAINEVRLDPKAVSITVITMSIVIPTYTVGSQKTCTNTKASMRSFD